MQVAARPPYTPTSHLSHPDFHPPSSHGVMFAGKSSLRAKETATANVDPALQAYLKRYESSSTNGSSGAGSGGDGKKKRKKNKPSASALGGGVRIVDESVTGFAAANAAATQPAGDEDEDDDYGQRVLDAMIASHRHLCTFTLPIGWPPITTIRTTFFLASTPGPGWLQPAHNMMHCSGTTALLCQH